MTSLLPELTLFSPFLRKPSSPKSDDSLTVTLTHDTEVYNAAPGSLVLLFSCVSLTGLISLYHLMTPPLPLPQHSYHVSCCSTGVCSPNSEQWKACRGHVKRNSIPLFMTPSIPPSSCRCNVHVHAQCVRWVALSLSLWLFLFACILCQSMCCRGRRSRTLLECSCSKLWLMVLIVNYCNLLRAAIIIFFQTQCRSMMARRGEWPMGLGVAWRRYLLTSATGAATVFQQQCRANTFYLKEALKDFWTQTPETVNPFVLQDSDTFFSNVARFLSFLLFFLLSPGPTAPSPLLLQSNWHLNLSQHDFVWLLCPFCVTACPFWLLYCLVYPMCMF